MVGVVRPISNSSRSSCSTSADQLCYCNKTPVQRIAWKNPENAGRRYLGCVDWSENATSGCNFFRWLDPPLTEKPQDIKNAEVKIKKLKDKVNMMKSRERMAWLMVTVSWGLLVCIWGKSM